MTTLLQISIISVSLALDALSVSIAGGVQTKKATIRDAAKIGVFFGGFQAGMPLLGWIIGAGVKDSIASIDHWVAFALLSAIGIKMIKDAFGKTEEKKIHILQNKTLFLLAIATSIDAFVVGITLGFIQTPLFVSLACIGIITFLLSFIGFLFGKKLGGLLAGKIEILGGVALIGIGLKILLEHLF